MPMTRWFKSLCLTRPRPLAINWIPRMLRMLRLSKYKKMLMEIIMMSKTQIKPISLRMEGIRSSENKYKS
jgi:hypothetical protein